MNEYSIAGIIILIGIIISLISKFGLPRFKKKERKEINNKDYDEEFEIKEGRRGFPLGNIIGAFIIILVGVSLFPLIQEQVKSVCNPSVVSNITSISSSLFCEGASGTLLNFVTIFFGLGIATAALAIAGSGLRRSGII